MGENVLSRSPFSTINGFLKTGGKRIEWECALLNGIGVDGGCRVEDVVGLAREVNL